MSKLMLRGSLRSTVCPSCRNRIFESFASFAGVPTPASWRKPIANPTTKIAQPHRTFTASLRRRVEADPGNEKPLERLQDLLDLSENEPASSPSPVAPPRPDESATPPPPSSTSIPWYLQVPPPISPPAAPPSAHLDVPPLPPYPPPILFPMLTFLSTNAGLTDLSLLDLRPEHNPSLNSPSSSPTALGTSLLMLLSTARSVKHLNHSADRFCRWLRSDPWQLTPYADGLLGRNELKVKLRRKARRARLASAAGRTAFLPSGMRMGLEMGTGTAGSGFDAGIDDGINTGWICVNVGEVDGGEEFRRQQEGRERRLRGFEVGFREVEKGPRVVVQMLTEEKRAELDLEGLYAFRRERKERKEERLTMDGEQDAEIIEDNGEGLSGGLDGNDGESGSERLVGYRPMLAAR